MLRGSRTLVLTSLLVVMISTLAAITNVPTNTPYSPFNTGVRGTSKLVEFLGNNLFYSLSEVFNGFNGTLVVALNKELPLNEYSRIEDLLSNGSRIIILDESGYSNNLLKYLGIDASVTNYIVLDEVFKYLSREYPLIELNSLELSLITYRPTYIDIGASGLVVAGSSKYSYADYDSNGYYSLGESMRSYPLIAQFNIGRGVLMVISDLDIVSNELIRINYVALARLVSSPTYVVVGYLGLSNIDYIKYVLVKTLPTGYRGGFEGSIALYSIIVVLSITSYYLVYRVGFFRRFRKLNLYTFICSLYLVVMATYKASASGDSFWVVPALINLAISLAGVDLMVNSVFIATLIYYSSINVDLTLYLLPTYVLLPYLMTSGPDLSLSGFLGPSTVSIIRYLSMMLFTSLVNLGILLPVTLMMAVSLINCFVHYIRLYSVRVQLLESPNEVMLRSKASLLMNTYSKHTAYLAIISDNGNEVLKLKDYLIVRYDLPTNHVGTYTLLLNLTAMDAFCFARRLLTPLSIKYLVVPSTLKLLESIRSEVFSRRDIRELLSGIELSIIEVGSGLVSLGSEGISKVLSDLGITGGISSFLSEFMRYLTSLDVEVFIDRLSSKGRYGEYVGVRPYLPSDDFRHIHWGKSLSHQELVVKEFTSSDHRDLVARSSSIESAVMIDLTVSDIESLDRLIFTLLNIYLGLIRVSLDVKVPLVILNNEFIVVMRGKALDVLYRLYKALSNIMPKLIYDYEAIRTEISGEYLKDLITYCDRNKYFSKLVSINKRFAEEIVKALIMNDLLPPKYFTILHSDVLSVRYGLVRYELSRYGYLDVDPGRLAQYVTGSGGRY